MKKRKRVHNKWSKVDRGEGTDNDDITSSEETNETVVPNKNKNKSTTGGSNCEEAGPSASLENSTVKNDNEAMVEAEVHYFPRKRGVRIKKLKANKSVTSEKFTTASSTEAVIGSQASASQLEKPYTLENKETPSVESRIAGFIFICSEKTKYDCFRYRVFGLPAGKLDVVKRIKRGTKLYLFDTHQKILYGIYSATSDGDKNLESDAFGGSFQAQVRFKIFKECVPLPERILKQAIKENYTQNKFAQELNEEQVRKLSSLFQSLPPPKRVPSTSLVASPRLQPGIGPQSNLPSVNGLGRVISQSFLPHPSIVGVPTGRAGYQVMPSGQHPHLVAKNISPHPHLVAKSVAPQYVAPNHLQFRGTGTILQHGPYQRLVTYEPSYRDREVAAIRERELYPTAYARGQGSGSVQPPVGFQRQSYAEFGHAYPSFSHTSRPSIKMNIAAPNHHVEFGRAYPTSSHTSQPSINISALNYNIPPWYQRS